MQDQPTTTVKLYKADVELMKQSGKYGETLADIFHRIVEKGREQVTSCSV